MSETVRITYNEYNREAPAAAAEVAERIKASLTDEDIHTYTQSVPYVGSGVIIKAEVLTDCLMSNLDAANRIADKINALGVEARAYHDCDPRR